MFCKAPWNSLVVHMDGNLLPDPVYKNTHPTKDINEYWKQTESLRKYISNNTFHENCISCKSKEEIVGWSRRKYLNQTLNDSNIEDKLDIQMLEINMSNNCNLKCRMCSGSYSTSWINDEKYFHNINWVDYRSLPRDYEDKGNVFARNANNLETVKQIVDRCPNIKFIAIKGGEPFIELSNIELLDYVIEKLDASNIILDIHTNGSKYSAEFVKRFNKFKKVNITVSMEAINPKLYSYIRGGDKIDVHNVIDNIIKFSSIPNAYVSVSTLWMAYNIFEPIHMYDFFINKLGIDIYFKNIVAFPRYLSYKVLPTKYLNEAYDKIITHIGDNAKSRKSGILKLAESFKNVERDYDSYYDFFTYTTNLDLIRDQNIMRACPWFDDYEKNESLMYDICSSAAIGKGYNIEFYNDPIKSIFYKSEQEIIPDVELYLKHTPWEINNNEYHIVEIGCGLGQHLDYMNRKFACKFTGIDVASGAIEYANKNFNGINFICNDALQHRPVNKYDACFSRSITFLQLHIINELTVQASIRMCRNILKPNGLFTYYDPNSRHDIKEYIKFFNQIGKVLSYESIKINKDDALIIVTQVNLT